MGVLFDGFETARKEHEERVAEHRRQEENTDRNLAELSRLLDEDGAFLREHDISHDIGNRILHVNHHRSPIIAIHYDPGQNHFRMISMRDNTSTTPADPEECARTIGVLLFAIVT